METLQKKSVKIKLKRLRFIEILTRITPTIMSHTKEEKEYINIPLSDFLDIFEYIIALEENQEN